MSTNAKHKRLYGLHEWFGILFGLFLFMVSFTGTVAMFYEELQFWEAPELRMAASSPNRVAPEGLIQEYLDTYPAGTHFENLFLSLPTQYVGTYTLFGSQHPPAGADAPEPPSERFTVRWNAATGEMHNSRGDGLAHWLRDIHRDLMLPNRTVGRFIVGLSGLLMLVSLISGVLTHKKILKEMFTLRVGRSKRLQWKDTHNALGTWALPFHAMIAFSGAYLGLVVLLLPIFAFTAFKGDQQAAIEAVLGAPTQPAGVAAEAYPISSVLQQIQRDTGYAVTGLRLEHYGDANAMYEAFLHPDDQLQYSLGMRISGNAEIPPPAAEVSAQTGAQTVLNAMVALHYATYGGIWLKLLYVGLGLLLCVMLGTGLMVWVERRANGPIGSLTVPVYQFIGRFNAGVMMGLPIATLVLFYVDRLIQVDSAARISMLGWTYMSAWLAVTALGASLRHSRLFVRLTLMLSGLLAMGILPLDAATIQASLLDINQRVALGFNTAMVLLGVLAFFVGWKLDRFYQPTVQQPIDWDLSLEAKPLDAG